MKKTEYFTSIYKQFNLIEDAIANVKIKRDEWIQNNMNKIGKIDLEKITIVNSYHNSNICAIISLTYYPKE